MVCKMISIVELSWAETGFKTISQSVNELIDHAHFFEARVYYQHNSASIWIRDIILVTKIIRNNTLGGVEVSFKTMFRLVKKIISH